MRKNIRFLSNTGPDLLKNLKATKPAFHVGPSSAVLGSSLPSSTKKDETLSKFDPYVKKSCQSWTPSDKTFWIRTWCGNAHLMHILMAYRWRADDCPLLVLFCTGENEF